MLIQGLRGNGLRSWAFGKTRSPAGDVIGHTELQVGLAEGSHDAVISGMRWKVTICQNNGLTCPRPRCPSLASSSSPRSRGLLLIPPKPKRCAYSCLNSTRYFRFVVKPQSCHRFSLSYSSLAQLVCYAHSLSSSVQGDRWGKCSGRGT